jgi:hypothetical protein
MKFYREIPAPKHEVGTLVCIGSYETPNGSKYHTIEQFGVITEIRISIWEDKMATLYCILGSWYPIQAIKCEVMKIEKVEE